jgi:hypothetical protein
VGLGQNVSVCLFVGPLLWWHTNKKKTLPWSATKNGNQKAQQKVESFDKSETIFAKFWKFQGK